MTEGIIQKVFNKHYGNPIEALTPRIEMFRLIERELIAEIKKLHEEYGIADYLECPLKELIGE